MPLYQESGGSAESRRAEATKLINQLMDAAAGFLTDKEQSFVSSVENERVPISPRQLFWLRDMRDRYC